MQLRISLLDVTPTVWRGLLVPGGVTLSKLHVMIQAAMGWEDYHLHAFEIDGDRYGVSDPEEDDEDVIDEETVILSDVVSGQARFLYEYDFGRLLAPRDCRRVRESGPADPQVRRVRRRSEGLPS